MLALALVIEVRVFVRQMSRRKKKKYLASLSERVIFVAMASFVIVALLLSLAIALPALRSGRSELGGEFFVECCLTFAFGFVVLSPVTAMSRALLADVRPRYELWRGTRRIEAVSLELARAVSETERTLTSRRLLKRIDLAERYIEAYKALAAAKKDRLREEEQGWATYLDQLDEWRARFESSVEESEALLEPARAHLRERPTSGPNVDLTVFARAIRELA